MKRFTLPASASRHQRGFFRATAIFSSVALISAGVVMTQQVKAHQYSHAKHLMAIKKLAVKDCGCSLLAFKGHNSKLYQTAISTGTDNFEHAVSLKAGQRLALGISDPTGAVLPGGTWQTNFGTVDASGIYTAPSFTPPEGLDRLHYADPNGNDIWISVRILPNLSIPNSAQTPTVTVAYTTGGAIQAPPAQSAQLAQIGDLPTPNQVFTPTSQTIVLLPGETVAPPQQISATAPLVPETVSGTSVLTLPATDGGGDATSVIYAQPLDETPQNVTLVPDVVAPSGPCTSGTTSVYGPYSTTVTPENGTVNLGDITGNASVEATVLKVLGLKLTLTGVYHVVGKIYDWKRTRTQYVYVCSNKKWVLVHTYHCDGLAVSLITFPSWAIALQSYPPNNQPRLPYTPDACHN